MKTTPIHRLKTILDPMPVKAFCVWFVLSLACLSTQAQTVHSLEELMPYLKQSDVNVTLAPGTYWITKQDIIDRKFFNPLLEFQGSNSTYDFTGVTLNIETEVIDAFGGQSCRQIRIRGNNNVLKNLTMVDVGSKYYRPGTTALNLLLDGRENRVEGFHMTIKGSYPYGYGDAFGKGGPYTIKHYKHSAILVRGESNHVLNCTIYHFAYGHAIFMQAADKPIIEGCYIKGEMRSTDDMLAETSGPAFDIDFLTVWGYKLPPGYMMSLQEEGIRAYNGGETYIDGEWFVRGTSNPTILNNTVVNMRSGVTLTHATGTKYVEGCTTIGCERGYAIGSGDIVDCSGDAQYGMLLGVDYETDKGINADLTVLPYDGEHYNGSHHLAFITGSNHNITFRGDVPAPDQELAINVGGDYRIISNVQTDENRPASDITIINETGYPLILDDAAVNITYESVGPVTDDSTTYVETLPCNDLSAFVNLEAEAECESSGIVIPDTGTSALAEYATELENGDWIKFGSVQFGRGAVSVEARAASAETGGNIEVRLGSVDGPLVGTVVVTPTGASETYATFTADLGETVVDTHDVFVVFTGGSGELFNLDYVKFVRVSGTENYAMSGTATQSSIDYEGAPERAIDGNTNGLWAGSSVTHTANEDFPWWEVDLGDLKNIGEIVIHPRTDSCCMHRLTFFTVTVMDNNRNEVFSQSFDQGLSGLTESLGVLTGGVTGSIVRIQLDEANPLSLAEVEVYPANNTATETWGGFPMDENGWVDTGLWMDWIYAGDGPYIYVVNFDSWIYLPEPEQEVSGAWIYVYK